MSPAPLINDEAEKARLAVLAEYGLIDTPREEAFDALVRQAAQLLGTPVAAISLVAADRVWLKAQVGLPGVSELPRPISFCQYGFSSSGIFVVPDARTDNRFAALPMVNAENGFVFYVGAPLRVHSGHSVGTICALDRVPRQLTGVQLQALATLAERTVELIERHRSRRIQASSFPPFPEETPAKPCAGRLLVVDDDAAVREFVCTATRQLGYAVTAATNGVEALDLVKQDPAAIELVLTDINMPEMDGLTLARALAVTAKPPRIAAMSGRFDSQIRADLRAAGVSALLAKPFTKAELAAALQHTERS